MGDPLVESTDGGDGTGDAGPVRGLPRREPPTAYLRRVRHARDDPRPLYRRSGDMWVAVAVGLLLGLTLVPLFVEEALGFASRLGTVLSLFYLLGAVGLGLRMGSRGFVVAAALVASLYLLTAWTHFVGLDDLYVIGLVVSFAVFVLAGILLVFLVEEGIHDIHRELLSRVRTRAGFAIPGLLALMIAVGLPFWTFHGGPNLPTLWIGSLVSVSLLGGWGFFRLFNDVNAPVLRGLHTLVVGGMAGCALVDGVSYLEEGASLLPSVVAYLALVATWFHVAYTAIQQAHLVVRGGDAAPWLAVVFSASFALLAHLQGLVAEGGGRGAVEALLDRRVSYLIAGVWLGLGFFLARAVWGVLALLRDARDVGGRSRVAAGRAARLAEELISTEQRLGQTAYRIYRGVERAIPGRHVEPRPPGWEFDAESEAGVPRRMDRD